MYKLIFFFFFKSNTVALKQQLHTDLLFDIYLFTLQTSFWVRSLQRGRKMSIQKRQKICITKVTFIAIVLTDSSPLEGPRKVFNCWWYAVTLTEHQKQKWNLSCVLRAERVTVKRGRFFETYQWTLSVLLNPLYRFSMHH